MNEQYRDMTINRTIVGSQSSLAETIARTVAEPSRSATGDHGTSSESLVFLLDNSGSMNEPFDSGRSKLDVAKNAIINTIMDRMALDPMDQVALVAFNSTAHVRQPLAPLQSNKRALLQQLQSVDADGGTDLDEAMRACCAIFSGARDVGLKRCVLITDGHGGNPLRTGEMFKTQGGVIDIVGVGACPASVDEKLLRRLASTIDGESRYIFVKDRRSLMTHFSTTIAVKV